jgi:hypothetical protein
MSEEELRRRRRLRLVAGAAFGLTCVSASLLFTHRLSRKLVVPESPVVPERPVSGGETEEYIVYDSGGTSLSRCRDPEAIRSGIVQLLAKLDCAEVAQNLGWIFRCGDKDRSMTLSLYPRYTPESISRLRVGGQWHGATLSLRSKLERVREIPDVLESCAFQIRNLAPNDTSRPVLVYVSKSYYYRDGYNGPRDSYCFEPWAFLARASNAATNSGCEANLGLRSLSVECTRPAIAAGCSAVLSGTAWFEGPSPALWYQGASSEVCGNNEWYSHRRNEPGDFGGGPPSFLLDLVPACDSAVGHSPYVLLDLSSTSGAVSLDSYANAVVSGVRGARRMTVVRFPSSEGPLAIDVTREAIGAALQSPPATELDASPVRDPGSSSLSAAILKVLDAGCMRCSVAIFATSSAFRSESKTLLAMAGWLSRSEAHVSTFVLGGANAPREISREFRAFLEATKGSAKTVN